MVIKIINKSSFETETLELLTNRICQQLHVKPKEIEFRDLKKTLFHGSMTVKSEKILISINQNNKYYPVMNRYNRKTEQLKYYNGYLDYIILDKYECLVHVLSHELRHLWQKYNRKNRDKWIFGSYGKFSNKDADSFAIKNQRALRKMINQPKYYPEIRGIKID